MESFDLSLKHLLALAPAELIGFGLGQRVVVVEPVPGSLAARRREVDGCYRVDLADRRAIIHVEFHRRHQSLEELAVDIADAQLRLFRGERLPVLTEVWDLYGDEHEPLLSERELLIGAQGPRLRCRFHRVNLRGIGWRELLAQGPQALWPLVALTRDGRSEEALRGAHAAIVAQTLPEPTRADHLAVLWFVAEAEQVPVRLLQGLLTWERLMQSTLYQKIFSEGEARGKALGRLMLEADAVSRVLTARLGGVELDLRQRIQAEADEVVLSQWYQEALLCTDAPSAQRLADKIQRASRPPG